jgi:DNA-binding NtrC family response regulator
MDKASQPKLLADSLRQEALNNQLEFLKGALLTTLDAVESVKASSLSESDHEVQLDEAVRRFEANLLRAALVHSQGNQARAARLLGVKVTTFHAKLKRHKIQYSD